MPKHIFISSEENNNNKQANLDKYGVSKKILKHIRNNVRKLSKVNSTVEYTLDLEHYANNLDFYVKLLNDNILLEEIDSNFVEHLNRMYKKNDKEKEV